MTTSSLNPFFVKALESISSKILIADKNLKVIYLNSSAEDFLNTTLEAVSYTHLTLPTSDLV